jgi:hypothetical protein
LPAGLELTSKGEPTTTLRRAWALAPLIVAEAERIKAQARALRRETSETLNDT